MHSSYHVRPQCPTARGRRVLGLQSAIVGACCLVLAIADAHARTSDAGRLMARLLGPTLIQSDLQELADSIGGRPTGTPALERAVEWGVAKFRSAGLEVQTESFAAAGIWIPHTELGEVTQPRYTLEAENALRVAAMPFSSPTPASGLEAEVVDVGAADSAAFAIAGNRVKGRWALIHTRPLATLDDLDREYFDTPPALERARASGAVGVLWMSSHSRRLLYRHNATLNGALYKLPAAVVERDGAGRIARLLQSGHVVRVRLRLQHAYVKDATARNVVAEIRGRTKPDESVILGAHLDSWDLGRGALDNGCNAVLVIDAARQMAAMAREGVRPERTVRFILYTGEETGFFGSRGDVRRHRAELDRVKAQVTFDLGTGRTTGFSLGGRGDFRAAVDAALEPAAALGPFTQSTDAFIGTDNYDYMIEGVPTLVANQDDAPYLPDYHAESDTFDKADLHQLHANAAIAAVLVWNLANAPKGPGPRQSHAEIAAMTRATGLDLRMKVFGLWDDFVSGARGRMP